MKFAGEEFEAETVRALRFALETARVRLKIDRAATDDMEKLAAIIVHHAKRGFCDVEGLARVAAKSFREFST